MTLISVASSHQNVNFENTESRSQGGGKCDNDRQADQGHHARLADGKLSPCALNKHASAVHQDDGSQNGRDQSRSGKSGGAVAKPVLYLAGPNDHRNREPEAHPKFVPKRGHRVPGVPGVARMLTYSCRVLAVFPVHPYFTRGREELVERLIVIELETIHPA